MTATDIIDRLLEGSYHYRQRTKQRQGTEAAGLGAAEDFYLAAIARVEPGKLTDSPGALAAYTHTWPEFEHWIAYNHNNSYGNPTEHERNEHRRFYNAPDEWHQYGDGVVFYEGKEARLPGVKGHYQWKVEWSRSSSTNWACQATVDIEWWDRAGNRIWKSHWKQPVMYDYKKDRSAYTQNREHWDNAHPDYFDTTPFDEKIKAKLVKEAQAFLAKLSKVAKIDKVRWNVPELFQEATPKSTKGFEQIGGDWGDPWEYGGTWVNTANGDIVHFDGVEGTKEIESDSHEVDKLLTPAHYNEILKAVSLEDPNSWESTEDEIRQTLADQVQAARKFPVYRTCSDTNETIEKDWADYIAEIKVSLGEQGEELWASMTPAHKLAEIANVKGWYEFDYSPDSYTKAELSVYLGIDL